MRVAGKRDGIRRSDLIGVAERFALKAPGEILERVEEVTTRWTEYAAKTGVSPEDAERIEAALVERRRGLG